MQNWHPSQEADTERFLLIDYHDIYGSKHLVATVVRAARSTERNEEGQCIRWNDGADAVGYRNASWSSDKKNAVFLESFAIHAYVDAEHKVFGVRPCFKDLHIVEVNEVAAMAKTLSKVNLGLQKEIDENGYLNNDDFAGTCIRVGKILGIKKFLTFRRDRSNLGTSEYFEHGPQYLRDVVQNLIEKGPRR